MAADKATFYAGAPGGDGRSTCRFCGRKLSDAQGIASGVCGRLECHDRMIQEAGQAILDRKHAKHREVTAEVLAKVPDALAQATARLGGGDATIGVLPAQDDPVEPLPADRLARFREHLEFCAEFAFRDPVPDQDLSAREEQEPEEQPEAAGACATCQGWCCKTRGGDTALLLPGDFARYRQRNPSATKDEVIEAYLAHLPATSTRDGCVYQAETGCALPREMRQDICNSYYCDPLRWLRQEFRESGTGNAVFVAADEGTPQRVAVLDANAGYVRIADLTGGGE